MNKCAERLYNGLVKENPTFVVEKSDSGISAYACFYRCCSFFCYDR